MERFYNTFANIFSTRFLILFSLFLLMGGSAFAQKEIEVKVWFEADMGEGKKKYPLNGEQQNAKLFLRMAGQKNFIEIGKLNSSGTIFVTVSEGDAIRISCPGVIKDKLIPIKKEKDLDEEVFLDDTYAKAMNFGEAKKSASRLQDAIGELKQKSEGNWLGLILNDLHPRDGYMKTNFRYVLQPVAKHIHGGASSGWKDFTPRKDSVDFTYLKPLVIDRSEFDITQRRMYDFNILNDSLAQGHRMVVGDTMPYRESEYGERSRVERGDTIKERFKRAVRNWNINSNKTSWYYAQDLRDNYVFYALMAYQDYHNVYRVDTAIIGVGTARPWLWMDYDFNSGMITEENIRKQRGFVNNNREVEKVIPQPARNTVQESSGSVFILFDVNSSVLNLEDSVNRAEVAKMNENIDAILNKEGTTLERITFVGKSSPEGGYAHNLDLARRRRESLKNYVRGRIGNKGRWIGDEDKVALWSELIPLLIEDSLTAEAEEIRAICDATTNESERGSRIAHLPYYAMLKDKYCPRLRSTTYTIAFKEYRQKSLDEIRDYYLKNGCERMSRYDVWQLYTHEPDTAKQMALLKELVYKSKSHSNDFLFANDLQSMLIEAGTSDKNLLTKYVQTARYGKTIVDMGTLVPEEVYYNHITALLHHTDFTGAYELLHKAHVKNLSSNKTLRTFVEVLSGDRDEAKMDMVANTSLRNHIIVLLMKDNEESNQVAFQLCDSLKKEDAPLGYYLSAVCQNRLDDLVGAEESLKRALRLKPSMKAVARYDKDLSSLPLFKDEWKNVFRSKEEIEAEERAAMEAIMKELGDMNLSWGFAKVKEEMERAQAEKDKANKEKAQAIQAEMNGETVNEEPIKGRKAKRAAKRAKKQQETATDSLSVASLELAVDSVNTEAKTEKKKSRRAKKNKDIVPVVASDSTIVAAPAELPADTTATEKKSKKRQKKSKSKKEKSEDVTAETPTGEPATSEEEKTASTEDDKKEDVMTETPVAQEKKEESEEAENK